MPEYGHLTDAQYERYRRNIVLPTVGIAGQDKLCRSAVLVVGAGGLGSPVGYYLAAAGVGRIGLIDPDSVSLSNLQRQILHTTADLGRPKVTSAGEKLRAINPDLQLEIHPGSFTDQNSEIIQGYDITIDCTDNFRVRYAINRACLKLNKPFVYGGVMAWAGQVFTIIPGKGPCFACVFPERPDRVSLKEPGILGPVPGVIGAIQAAEAIRFILGVGELLVGRILTYDCFSARFYEVPVEKDAECPACRNPG